MSEEVRGYLGHAELAALRAYQTYHADATIYTVAFAGRTFWLTGKQLSLWHQIMRPSIRGRRTTLDAMAERAMCSRATVSRFLKRLDLWRVVDVATMPGRRGGTYILTVHKRMDDASIWLSGAKPTYASRRIARDRIAQAIRRLQLNRLKPILARYRLPPRPWHTRMGGGWLSTNQPTLLGGNTDATFR